MPKVVLQLFEEPREPNHVPALEQFPGGSRLLIEAQIPYDALALAAFLGFAPAQACGADTAIAMARTARARAARLVPAGTDLVGLGAMAALVSDRPRRGEHRCHIAFANAAGIAQCTCVMAKRASAYPRNCWSPPTRLLQTRPLNGIGATGSLEAVLPTVWFPS